MANNGWDVKGTSMYHNMPPQGILWQIMVGVSRACKSSAKMAGEPWREDIIHRAGKSPGERVYRVIQWKAEGRVSQSGDILHAHRSKNTDCEMDTGLQPGPAA